VISLVRGSISLQLWVTSISCRLKKNMPSEMNYDSLDPCRKISERADSPTGRSRREHSLFRFFLEVSTMEND